MCKLKLGALYSQRASSEVPIRVIALETIRVVSGPRGAVVRDSCESEARDAIRLVSKPGKSLQLEMIADATCQNGYYRIGARELERLHPLTSSVGFQSISSTPEASDRSQRFTVGVPEANRQTEEEAIVHELLQPERPSRTAEVVDVRKVVGARDARLEIEELRPEETQ